MLIAYDGSEDSQAAVRDTGRLLPGRKALVLTIWEPVALLSSGAHAVLPSATVQEAWAEMDDSARDQAERTASEGAALADEHGLNASARAVKAEGSVWLTIARQGEELNAAVVAMGSRGRTPVKAALLGSVSSAVSAHARSPVLLVRADESE